MKWFKPLTASVHRTTSVVVTSIGSATFVYILVAITGYLSFGNDVAGNIVGMCEYRHKLPVPNSLLTSTIDIPSIASTIGKAAIVILVMFSYPLQVHPCRASVDAVLKWRPYGLRASRISNSASPSRSVPLLAPARPTARNDTISELRFAIITTVIIILSYTVAMTVSSLDKVLAYVGSTGSTSISFILPGLFYYKISSPDSIHHQQLSKEDDDDASDDDDEEDTLIGQGNTKRLHWRKTILRKLSLALAIYGIFVMVICLATNIIFSAAAH